MESIVVRMVKINKSFSRVRVLQDISFSLKEKEIHGLLGKNGAGKSTLMKILAGVEKQDNGFIEIFDKRLEIIHQPLELHKKIAMIFQEFSLIPSLSVSDNIFLPLLPYLKFRFIPFQNFKKESSRVLQLLGIEIDPDIIVEKLSVAEKQFVEIAKALNENKKILIMDEPTAALSIDQTKILFNVMKKLNDQGVSIVYISHDIKQVFEVCDRITVLRDGRNILTTEVKNTTVKEIVENITGQSQVKRSETRFVGFQKKQQNKEPLLIVKNLKVGQRVNGVSFKIFPGEIVGIAGLTGSGRTELLESISGMIPFQNGKVIIKGNEFDHMIPRWALKAGLILIPDERQSKGLVTSHTIHNNLTLSILKTIKSKVFLNFIKSKEISKKLIETLNIITTGFDQRVDNLSGGNQQKVVLSRMFSRNLPIILLDDPTLGIDVESKKEIINLVRKYAASGDKAVILVSSEIEVLVNTCDRVLFLRKGEIIDELISKGGDEISEANILARI
jgi:ribose transport system ATP-binding protein